MKLAIIGTGHIGGSVGAGSIESGMFESVCGYDRSQASAALAVEKGCVHKAASSLAEMGDADLWLLAVPPPSMPGCLSEIAPYVKADAAISDCAGVKLEILAAVPEALRSRFVGGHPIAGTEHQGIAFAQPDLFRDRLWVLTPMAESEPWAIRRVEQLVYALDARPLAMDPEEHDRQIALFSQLPHVLAAALVRLGSQFTEGTIAGTSWRDLTRVAGSNPPLWASLVMLNRPEILSALEALQIELDGVRALVESARSERLEAYFADAALLKPAVVDPENQ